MDLAEVVVTLMILGDSPGATCTEKQDIHIMRILKL